MIDYKAMNPYSCMIHNVNAWMLDHGLLLVLNKMRSRLF